ncbi:CSLREA domain-containing protein [Pseudomarimonas arenosa]|uniref:CSLREA domain-containing protein n=1 Tax=Pseudomarimonas arenosa TaxID=2774145 RepID=A0AAW3ZL36_9GAMM|nr:CSLREA domain-containing protein [Pseudomarimonas arenosa]MBD8525397.1 CSLREA domain-containing protein [Pseudomarimonas arenosa]
MPKPQLLALALSQALASNAIAGVIIDVTTTADEQNTNGQCSLREALLNTASGDQSGSTDCPAGAGANAINLPADQTLTLSSALPELDGFDALNGNNSTLTRAGGCNLDGNTDAGEFRLLTVAVGSTLSLASLSLTNGCADGGKGDGEGGGILAEGADLTLTDVTLSGNSAFTAGGGLSCKLTTSCGGVGVAFDNNRAGGKGGGLYIEQATGTLSGGRFSGNSAGANGGGLYLRGGFLSVAQTSFSGNAAAADGGAAMAELVAPGDRLNLDQSLLSGNTAIRGGGVFLRAYSTLSNSTLSGNSAAYGGGLYVDTSNGSLSLTDSSLVDNIASIANAQLRTTAESTINLIRSLLVSDGTTGCSVAGITNENSSSMTTDSSCVVSNVTLQSRSALQIGALADNGGPLYSHALGPASIAIDAAGLTCSGQDGRGYARPVDGNNDSNAYCDVGAFEFQNALQSGPNFVVNRVTDINDGQCTEGIDGCSLREAVIAANGNDDLSEITFDPDVFASSQTSTLTLGFISIVESATITGPGADLLTLDANDASFHFGVNIPGVGTATLSDLRLINGTSGSGGAISSFDSLFLSRMTLESNTAGNAGGALSAGGFGDVTISITDSRFINNNGGSGIGGGLTINTFGNTNILIDGSDFSGNSAFGGGALHVDADDGNVTISNSTITGNTATCAGGCGGGGIFIGGSVGTTTLQNLLISGNLTSSTGVRAFGGGLAVESYNGHVVQLLDSTVSENTVTNTSGPAFGGGIAVNGNASSFIVDRSTISGNAAEESGGGLDVTVLYGGSTSIRNSTVSGNRVDGSGGGMRTMVGNLSRVSVEGSTITGNIADNDTNGSGGGGGLSLNIDSANTVSLQGSVIAANQDLNAAAAPDIERNGRSLTLANSLIGDNAGSGLNEAPIGSPDLGFNLIGSAAGGGVIDPLLGPLADNGGASFTHLPADTSPLIDHFFVCSGSDQRGRPRGADADGEAGNDCDVGAVEVVNTVFHDGFEDGIITKRFEQRNLVLSRAEITARLGPTRSQALLMRAGTMKRNGDLVLVHGRRMGNQIQLQLNRYEHGEWTQGAWQTMHSETVQLRW